MTAAVGVFLLRTTSMKTELSRPPGVRVARHGPVASTMCTRRVHKGRLRHPVGPTVLAMRTQEGGA